MVCEWILIDKKTGEVCNYHNAKEKPVFGNNGKETKTNEKHEWVSWRQELPEESYNETGGYIKIFYDKKKNKIGKK